MPKSAAPNGWQMAIGPKSKAILLRRKNATRNLNFGLTATTSYPAAVELLRALKENNQVMGREEMNKIAALATELGVSEADAIGFIGCLRVFTDKGYTIEQAIERNLATWVTLLDRVNHGSQSTYSPYRPAAEAMQSFAMSVYVDAAAVSRAN